MTWRDTVKSMGLEELLSLEKSFERDLAHLDCCYGVDLEKETNPTYRMLEFVREVILEKLGIIDEE